MAYEFSWQWLFIGLAITAAGALIVIFYRQIANNLASGVASYDKVKLFGIITVIIGLICTANLHTFLLGGLIKLMFGLN